MHTPVPAKTLDNKHSGGGASFRIMQRFHSEAAHRSLSGEQQLREAILLTFCEPVPSRCARLQHVSRREWERLLPWLDTSGLALYFLDRITELGLCEMLPPTVLARLRQNLADNTARMEAMIVESSALHRDFQEAGLSYATLKGFSLWPVSVPKLELRSQLDLDFLMAEVSAPEARRILEGKGYRLHAISGRSWEFKAGQLGPCNLKGLYKTAQQRSVELHLETGGASLLARTETLYMRGVRTPVLPAVDLFLGQALHLYKHVCGESMRAAHLIEFRRHVLARYHDDRFWVELRELAEGNSRTPIALGLVTLLVSRVMGDFAPDAFTCWTLERVPAAARLWVEMYGERTVFAGAHGSKLYLLLQQAMEQAGVTAKRSVRQALLPRGLPPAIAHAEPGERMAARLFRYRRQLHFIWLRLRFHTVEGLRYLIESARWRRQIKRLANEHGQPCTATLTAAMRRDRVAAASPDGGCPADSTQPADDAQLASSASIRWSGR
jgi:Uncharacterised nucleotidyltransferase